VIDYENESWFYNKLNKINHGLTISNHVFFLNCCNIFNFSWKKWLTIFYTNGSHKKTEKTKQQHGYTLKKNIFNSFHSH